MTALIPATPACPATPAWQLPTDELLVHGGDERLLVDPASGTNRYGCRPRPDPAVLDFASSTASIISPASYAAADALRRRLSASVERRGVERTWERALGRLQGELLALLGVNHLAGLEGFIAPSGTDLHSLALALAGGEAGSGITVLLPEAAETGSGVPAALAGPALRLAHPAGGRAGVDVQGVALREADGTPRPVADVDADFRRLAASALAAGRRVLAVVLEVSKTGLAAPSRAGMAHLLERDGVTVLVDACQARLSRARLRHWLEGGALVALTGSKFYGGPAFSGVLLVPQGAAAAGTLEAARRAEQSPNFGVLLRWEAALAELRPFAALDEDAVEACLQEVSASLVKRLREDGLFDPLPDCGQARAETPDRTPGILPFRLRDGQGHFLEAGQVSALYRALSRDLARPGMSGGEAELAGLRCRLGQPVACGGPGGQPAAALRLAISARQVVAAVEAGTSAPLVVQVEAVLDKLAWLIRSGCR